MVFAPDFTSGTGDGKIQGSSTTYATARSTSTQFRTNLTTRDFGQVLAAGTYYLNRGFLAFDTSSIGAGSTVTAVTLTLTIITNFTATATWTLLINKQDWSAQDPISDANREAAYDNVLTATQDDNSWSAVTPTTPAVNTPTASGALATAYVNKTGTTYYSTISDRELAATTPTDAEYADFAMSEHATSAYRPTLNVTYTSPGGVASILPILSDYYRRKKVQ